MTSDLIERLLNYEIDGTGLRREAADEIARLTAERDEAMAEVCQMDAIVHVLDIEDSHVTPVEAIEALLERAEIAECERDAARAAARSLMDAIYHPLLRQVCGDLEGSRTDEGSRLWSILYQWFDVKSEAYAVGKRALSNSPEPT